MSNKPKIFYTILFLLMITSAGLYGFGGVSTGVFLRDNATSTLDPVTANDNLDMGTGTIAGGDLRAVDDTTAAYKLIIDSDSDGTALTADHTLTLDVNNEDHTVDLFENLSIGDGADFTLTAEDTAGSITLDEQTFEVEGEGTATQLTKIVNANNAAATITLEGTGSVIDQDVTADAGPQFAGATLTADTSIINTTAPSLIIDNSTTGADADSGYVTLRGNDGAADTELDMSLNLDVTTTTDYKISFWDDGKAAEVGSLDESGNLQIDGTLTAGGIATPYTKTVTVSAAGADYTTIQAALDDNTSGGELVLVYPGTYTNDTINFTANNQCVVGVGAPIQQEVTNTTTICAAGAYTNCTIENIKFSMTSTTAQDMITGSGSMRVKYCVFNISASGTIAGNVSAINYTGNLWMERGRITYNNVATSAGQIKRLITAGAGSVIDFNGIFVDMDGSNTADALTLGYSSGTGIFNIQDCDIDIDDTDATIIAGFANLTGSGDNEYYRNNIHVTCGGAGKTAYGYLATSATSLAIRSTHNHIHILDGGGGASYGFSVGANVTLTSQFDDVIAEDGNTGAGTLVYANSIEDGEMHIAKGTEPKLNIINTTKEDTDAGREGHLVFKGTQSGGEQTTLARIVAQHDGTLDDQKGDLVFQTNDGTDGDVPTERVRFDSAGAVTVAGLNTANGLVQTDGSGVLSTTLTPAGLTSISATTLTDGTASLSGGALTGGTTAVFATKVTTAEIENAAAITIDSTGAGVNITTDSTAGDDFTVGGTKFIVEGDKIQAGIGTSAPDAALEINSATGDNLQLSYNDADGSATYKADFQTTSTGNLSINASGNEVDFNGDYATSLQNFPDVVAGGPGYWFDGVDDTVGGIYDAKIPIGDVSFSAIVIAKPNAASNDNILFSIADGTGEKTVGGIIATGALGFWNNSSGRNESGAAGADPGIVSALGFVYGAGGGSVSAIGYVNGKAYSITGGQAFWDTPTASTFNVGSGGGDFFDGEIYSTKVFNLALTADEVKAFSNGAPIPYKYIGASQTELIAGWTNADFNAFTSSGTDITEMVSTGANQNCYSSIALKKGKQYRLSFTSSAARGNLFVRAATVSTGLGPPNLDILTSAASGTNSIEFTSDADYGYIGFLDYGSGFADTQITNFTLTQIGCVLDLEPEGVGHDQWTDISGNELHGTVSGAINTNLPSKLNLKNTTAEDGDGGRESQIIFAGTQSGGEVTTLAKIQASHDATGDDQKGDLIFYTNDGTDNNTPTERLRVDSAGAVTVAGLNTANGLVQTDGSGVLSTTLTPSGLTSLGVSGAITATGAITGNTDLTIDTDPTITLGAADCRGSARFNGDADVIDYTLPGAAAGLTVLFYDIGGGVITVDPVDGTDTIYLNGTSVGAGDAIDSPGAVGDFIVLMAIDDTRWVTVGRSGTWVDGGAD